jgi:hypothetical protein
VDGQLLSVLIFDGDEMSIGREEREQRDGSVWKQNPEAYRSWPRIGSVYL